MLEPMYRCERCGDLHECEDDAVDCCLPGSEKVWVCSFCEREFDDGLQPEACCETDDGEVLPASAQELEAAGQLRLVK